MENCIFCKIIDKKIPSTPLYEDEQMLIINDIAPKAKLHYLLIPKIHYKSITQLDCEKAKILANCLQKLAHLANDLKLEEGFRLIINNGENANQLVPHLHIHILGGEKLQD